MKKFLQILATIAKWIGSYLAVMAALGAYDVTRNTKLDESVVKRYFIGNGLLTWALSPLNVLMDLLALPYVNKGVYKLDDLPPAYRGEIQKLIDTAKHEKIVEKMESLAKERARTMVFWKWYGTNVDAVVDVPAYHDDYQFVKTIGLSVFNKKQLTSKHFGPFRPTLRVLYNVNDITDESAYIEVGEVKHYWKDEKLFIFDDTLMHQSFNETDQIRYCLFVDILRPSMLPGVFAGIVGIFQFFLRGANYIFYKNWDVIKS